MGAQRGTPNKVVGGLPRGSDLHTESSRMNEYKLQRLWVREAWRAGKPLAEDLPVQRENRTQVSCHRSTREGENSISYLKYHGELRSLS